MSSPTSPSPNISLPGGLDPETGEPLPPGEDRLTSFFSADGVSRALEACEFTREELVTRLIQLVRDPDPKIAVKGLSQLTTYLNNTARLSGAIGKVKVEKADTRDASGALISSTSHSVELNHRVTGALARGRPALSPPNRGQEFIPAQVPPSSDGPPLPSNSPPGQVE